MTISDGAAAILKRLTDCGYEAYAVGGSVRDTLLGTPPDDWDIATSAPPQTVAEIFSDSSPTSSTYGTVTVRAYGGKYEITPFRHEGRYLDGRHPSSVTFTGSIYDDLSRRDFTMNAMALSKEGDIIDPFGGLHDLQDKIIRCVAPPEKSFSDDALRMFRAIRFSSVLGMSISGDTLSAIKSCATGASRISAERISGELTKVITSPHPEKARLITENGLISHIIVADNVDTSRLGLIESRDNRLAAYAVILSLGSGSNVNAAEKLRFSRTVRKKHSVAMKLLSSPSVSPDELIIRLGRDPAMLMRDVYLAIGEEKISLDIDAALDSGRIISVPELTIDGLYLKELGYSGRSIGVLLTELALMVSRGEIKNERVAISEYLKK